MRGEHSLHVATIVTGGGSSPHARGTRQQLYTLSDDIRFIPACAGNTPPTRSPRRPRPVHPRMRGEHEPTTNWLKAFYGSSPHARGTPSKESKTSGLQRFIPACAGNTIWCAAVTVTNAGSSPHARGTLMNVLQFYPTPRFIPACAGNTRPSAGRAATRTVHPRMRGEHEQNLPNMCRITGSSPHARGTQRPGKSPKRFTGFIPACAGNTVK